MLLQERQQGKSFALNTGLAAATGDVLALTDDDVLPATRLARADRRRRSARSDVTFVFGKVLPRWTDTPPPELLTPAAQAIWGPLAIVDYGDEPSTIRVDSTGPAAADWRQPRRFSGRRFSRSAAGGPISARSTTR